MSVMHATEASGSFKETKYACAAGSKRARRLCTRALNPWKMINDILMNGLHCLFWDRHRKNFAQLPTETPDYSDTKQTWPKNVNSSGFVWATHFASRTRRMQSPRTIRLQLWRRCSTGSFWKIPSLQSYHRDCFLSPSVRDSSMLESNGSTHTVVFPKEGQMRFPGQASRSNKFAILWAADNKHNVSWT
jgi:hypothetical protein